MIEQKLSLEEATEVLKLRFLADQLSLYYGMGNRDDTSFITVALVFLVFILIYIIYKDGGTRATITPQYIQDPSQSQSVALPACGHSQPWNRLAIGL